MTGKTSPTAFLPLPPLDLQILLAVAETPLHGYGMMKAVEAQSEGALRVELGSLYRMIHRLERNGLIGEAVVDAEPGPGRDRRFYEITELGHAVLQAELNRLHGVLKHAEAARLRPGEA